MEQTVNTMVQMPSLVDTTRKSPLLTSSLIFSTFSFSCKCMYIKAVVHMKQVTTKKNPNTDMHMEQHETRPLVLNKIKYIKLFTTLNKLFIFMVKCCNLNN